MAQPQDSPAPPAIRPRGGLVLVYAALMLAILLAALDQTIVSTALPTIVGDLGGLNYLSWVVTAYILASTASTPLWGKLGDQYGRKRLFQAAIVIFLIGSALCGLAQSMVKLIAFRALQGLGGGEVRMEGPRPSCPGARTSWNPSSAAGGAAAAPSGDS